MAYLDNHPQLARLIIGALAVYLFSMAAYNFYRYAGSPADENWFTKPPANLYVIESFPGRFVKGVKKSANAAAPQDSIRVGDLVVAANGKRVDSLGVLTELLRALPADSIELNIFRPTLNRYFTYRAAKSALPDSFVRVLPPTAYVFDVFKNGASDRAGMKVGDLIFRINKQNFKNYLGADVILRQSQSGKTIDYEVIRDNREITLHVKLAKFGAAIPIMVWGLCGLAYFGFGAFVFWQRPQIKAARLVGLAFLLIGYFFGISTIRPDVNYDAFAVARDLTGIFCVFWGIAAWAQSEFYFPKERPELLAKRWRQYVPYAIAAFIIALYPLKVLNVNQNFGAGVVLASVLAFGYTLAVKFIYRKQCPAEHKKLSRIIKWTGITAGVLSFVLAFFIGRTGKLINLGYLGIPLVFIPLSYLYTIGRYRLLEMDLRVRRNVQYTVASLVWTILLVVLALNVLLSLPQLDLALPNVRLTGGSIEILDSPMLPEQRQLLEKGVLIFLAIGLTFAFWQIGRIGQRLLVQKFNRTQFDYRRAATELAEVMATRLSMDDLSRGIVQKLVDLMQLQRAGVLFFRDQKTCCCEEAYGFDGNTWKDFCMRFDRKLAEVIQQFRSESRFSVDYLPHEIKESFQQHGFRHIIPIRFKEKLVGTLLVGEKRSETPFYSDDLAFLAAVAKQASVAIENAFLHEQLSEQERLKHELAIARRIQLASLPQTTPKIDGLDIAGISIPAMEVGGDYFDYLNGVPNAITVIVGDVSGKGTSAALYMSKVQGILRSLHGFRLSPRELFIRANQLLCHDMEKKSFVTSLGADFDSATRRLVLARAGHLPLFYYQAQNRKVEKITPKGLGLGLDNHGVFANELEEKVLQYETGDIFLFVTDGVTEAQGRNGSEFGEEGLLKILENNSTLSAHLIRDRVITAVKQFAGETKQHDDQTVVVVKVV
jgi:sigma-B regulation protein RsbU (phosphoserine phosphatase)